MRKIYYFLIGIAAIAVVLVFLLFTIRTGFFYNNKLSTNVFGRTDQKIVLPSSLAEQLGQNFILGFEGTSLDENTKNILTKIKPAGIVLYYRNYKNPRQLKDLISQLQVIAKTTTNRPYFIMIDEEPGGAMRLDLFDDVFAFGTPDWAHIEMGIKALQTTGINVDLAPVADFPFDGNSFIKSRVAARDPALLTDFNQKFIAMLKQHHVSATLKHFPGMGVFVDDPHKKLPYANPDASIIEQSLAIFKSGIDGGADFVMTGHGVYDDIDPKNPATLSKKIVTDMLRKQLGFSGLIITDDLSDMPFIIGKNINLTEAAANSLEAGHNLVLFSHRPEETEIIFDKLLSTVEKDKVLQSIISQNYIKVVSLKNSTLN